MLYSLAPEIVEGAGVKKGSSAVGTPTIDGLGPYREHPHSTAESVRLSFLKLTALNPVLLVDSSAS